MEIILAFTHLHLHTNYSICDSIVQLDPLFDRLKQFGHTAVAMTDHGNLYGAVDFYKKAVKNNIKPIIGCEFYLAKGLMTDKTTEKGKKGFSHLILLAKNEIGYKNIVKLSSVGFTKGFYYKPRIDKQVLSEYKDGLICLPACLAGSIQQLVLSDRINDAIEEVKWYRSVFGDDFYLELQEHNIPKERIIRSFFKEMSNQLGIPLVVTNDTHYLDKDDAEAHDAMLCIGTGKKMDDPDRQRYDGTGYHLMSESEMAILFPDDLDAIHRTCEVADKVDFELDLKTHHFPKYAVPSGSTLNDYLEKKTYDGAQVRFNGEITKEIEDRIQYELRIIKECGFSEYFLVVHDFIRWARDRGIAIGPGRGSCSASIVVYCLFITDINPLKYGLFFERFLNPERISMPDIDIDFCYFRRQDVIDYVTNKYGKENVSSIITFGVLGAKSALNAVAKVLGIPFQESQRISKMVLLPADTIDNNIKANDELKSALEENSVNRELLDVGRKLGGCIKYAGIHASGIVIADGGIDNFVPLTVDKEGQLATQFDMESVDAAGMLKVDFLGLRTMTVISETERLIKQRKGIDIKMLEVPLDDDKVYRMLDGGETAGIFQLESHGMRKLLGRLGMQNNNFADIVALVALYRPGPLQSGMTDRFINRKNGYEQITYLHESMRTILEETYGVIVYQEQIMQLSVSLCGFTMGRGDVLRKAMGKKKQEVMDAMREEFVNGGVNTSGLSHGQMTNLFEEIAKFAAYGFNKAHSTGYALIAYWTAYLKANYTIEFMASLLTSIMDKDDKIKQYYIEAKRLNIPVMLPDINESYRGFEVTADNKIRCGLAVIRNLGSVGVDKILADRNKNGSFSTLENFCSRVRVSKKVVESLIKCGCFDSIANRGQLLSILPDAISIGKDKLDKNDRGQLTFDDLCDDLVEEDDVCINLPNIADLTDEEKGRGEKEILGMSISYNHLEVAAALFLNSAVKLGNLEDYVGKKVELPVVINGYKSKTYSQGIMLYVDLMDDSGAASGIVFERTRNQCQEILTMDNIVIIQGRVDKNDDKVQIIIDKAILPDKSQLSSVVKPLQINVSGKSQTDIMNLQGILSNYSGGIIPVDFVLNGEVIPSDLKVGNDNQMLYLIVQSGFEINY